MTGAKGRIEANSVNADVEVHRCAGEISTETVNGSIELAGTDATTLTATSVNGDLSYDGPVHPGGRYSLSTHNGDITLAMAEGAGAAVSVSTFNGEFESDFPVTLDRDPKGQAVQLHRRLGKCPGHAGVVPGHHQPGPPRQSTITGTRTMTTIE